VGRTTSTIARSLGKLSASTTRRRRRHVGLSRDSSTGAPPTNNFSISPHDADSCHSITHELCIIAARNMQTNHLHNWSFRGVPTLNVFYSSISPQLYICHIPISISPIWAVKFRVSFLAFRLVPANDYRNRLFSIKHLV